MELRQFTTKDEIFTKQFGKKLDDQPGALSFEQKYEDIMFWRNGINLKICYPEGYLPYVNPNDPHSKTGKVIHNPLYGFAPGCLAHVVKSEGVRVRMLFGSDFGEKHKTKEVFTVAFKIPAIKYVLLTVQGELEANEQHELVTVSETVTSFSEETGSGMRPVRQYVMNLASLNAFRKKMPLNESDKAVAEEWGRKWVKEHFSDYLRNLQWTKWHDTKIKTTKDTVLCSYYNDDREVEEKTFNVFCFDDGLTCCMGYVITPYGAFVGRNDLSSTQCPVEFYDCRAQINAIQTWKHIPEDDLIMLVESFFTDNEHPYVRVWFDVPEKVTDAQKNRVTMLEGDFVMRIDNLIATYSNYGFSATTPRAGEWVRRLETQAELTDNSSRRS